MGISIAHLVGAVHLRRGSHEQDHVVEELFNPAQRVRIAGQARVSPAAAGACLGFACCTGIGSTAVLVFERAKPVTLFIGRPLKILTLLQSGYEPNIALTERAMLSASRPTSFRISG